MRNKWTADRTELFTKLIKCTGTTFPLTSVFYLNRSRDARVLIARLIASITARVTRYWASDTRKLSRGWNKEEIEHDDREDAGVNRRFATISEMRSRTPRQQQHHRIFASASASCNCLSKDARMPCLRPRCSTQQNREPVARRLSWALVSENC